MPTSAPLIFDDALDFLRMNAAASVVDIRAVWLVMRHCDLRAEFAQNARRRFVGRAICDIDGDAHFFERHSSRKTRLGEFNVTAKRIINSRGASDFAGRRADGIDLAGENQLLNFLLDLVIQFVAVVPEKFDAIVLDKDCAKRRGRCRRRRAAIV